MKTRCLTIRTLLSIVLISTSGFADTGDQLKKLVASDAMASDFFGIAVAVDGSTTLVGAYETDDSGIDSGSAYLFDATSGAQLAKLTASDGSGSDQFGYSVGISGSIAIVGAYLDDDSGQSSGSAYLFDTVTGTQIAKLVADDAAANDCFGYSVAISGTTAIVGSYLDDDNGTDSGSAYVIDTSSGLQVAKLLASDGATNDFFGFSVAISGTSALVGAYWHDEGATETGSAYLFDTVTGVQVGKLTANDSQNRDHFGYSVAISGTTALVGARDDDDVNGSLTGSAYIFDTCTGIQLAKLVASDGASSDFFGNSVAIGDTTAVVGSFQDDDNGSSSGSAYLFDATNNAVSASTTVRNGSGLNALLFSKVSDPVLASNWDTDVDATGHAPSVVAVVVYEQPFSGILIAGGELLVDLTSPLAASLSLAHSGSSVRFSIPVPVDLSFLGTTVSAQAVVFGAPALELSNALDLVLGF